jgi:hypothetical protein
MGTDIYGNLHSYVSWKFKPWINQRCLINSYVYKPIILTVESEHKFINYLTVSRKLIKNFHNVILIPQFIKQIINIPASILRNKYYL